MLFFFFKQKTAYEMRISDWSSDVCSSDLSTPMRPRCTCRSARPRTPSRSESWRPSAATSTPGAPSRSPPITISAGHALRLNVSIRLESHHDRSLEGLCPATGAGERHQDQRRHGRLRPADPSAPRLAGRSEEHTSELQSLMRISYAVFF